MAHDRGFAYDLLSGDVRHLGTDELRLIIEICSQELSDRARERGDIGSVIEHAMEVGFDQKGFPRQPWTDGDLLIVPGGWVGGLRGTHRCRFGAIGDQWVWQLDNVVGDQMRRLPDSLRTVTVLPALPGTELDIVTSQCRSGVHRRSSAERLRLGPDSRFTTIGRTVGPARDHR